MKSTPRPLGPRRRPARSEKPRFVADENACETRPQPNARRLRFPRPRPGLHKRGDRVRAFIARPATFIGGPLNPHWGLEEAAYGHPLIGIAPSRVATLGCNLPWPYQNGTGRP